MSWDSVLLDYVPPGTPLPTAIDRLFDQQRQQWELFRTGEASLKMVQTKSLTMDGDQIIVQSNPGRRISTYAKVDAASVAQRSCFLCPQNMPADERGIAWGPLVILPNPYPVLRQHCTVPTRDHQPQQIEGRIELMLQLAAELGPDMIVFYNGPRCGASAPDHFHFQACSAKGIPGLTELPTAGSFQRPLVLDRFGRRMLFFREPQSRGLNHHLTRAINAMQQVAGGREEAMLNLITRFRDGHYWAWLVPRQAHRPRCYSAGEPQRLAISPAALEMAGLLVVAEPDHFDRVDAQVAHQIYTEVSLDRERFTQLVGLLR